MKVFFQPAVLSSVTVSSDVRSGGEAFADEGTALDLVPESW